LPRLLLLGALMSPATLYALGLGEIRLNSSLNQPFDADIEVIAPTREELADLKVTLANNELFQRYGIDRPAYLSSFDFSVTRSRDGQVTIKVTSNRSVTEPFVTFLVEANWGRGRLLREYTVLLDPPVFMPSQPDQNRPVTAPESGARTEGRIERTPEPQQRVPAPESTTDGQPESAQSAPAAVVGGNYEVKRNDTLSRIARKVNPDATAAGINQTMIALFRANPEAFVDNINVLKAGSVLRVPELSEIESISRGDAASEVARQQEAWSGAFRGASEETGAQLKLVTPEDAPATAAPSAPTPSQPTPSTSSSDAASGAAATPDRRLEVESPGLAGVQQGVDETQPQPAPATPDADTPAQPQADAPADETPQAGEPVPEQAPAQPRQAPVQQASEPSLLERIGDFWWVPVVAGLLLVIFLILTFLKRKRESADAVDLDSFSPSFEPRLGSSRRAEEFSFPDDEPEPTPAFDDDIDAEPVTAARAESPKTRPGSLVTVGEPKTADDTLSSETSVRFDQQDALAEADFHMAYGLYDQAADLVKIAIDREPQRRDLKLKLLEIYFVWGNRDLFLDTARDLHGTRNEAAPGEWDKVLIMGRQIAPEDPIFKGEGNAARLDLVDVNLEGGENRVDVDLFAEPESEAEGGLDLQFGSGEHASLESTQESSDSSDLNFLLDEPQPSEEEPTREMDQLARTQETPTIESPALDRESQTIREKIDSHTYSQGKNGTEQTAELSLDDLGLDVDSLEATGALEHTAALEKDDSEEFESSRPLRDDEMTQLAPSLSSFDRPIEEPRIGSNDRTVESPRLGSTDKTMESPRVEKFDIESTGTIYIDQVDLSGGDTVEQPRIDIDATASMAKPRPEDLDVDLDSLGEPVSGDTVRHVREDDDRFSDDVFAERTGQYQSIDLDVGEALNADDHAPTNKQVVNEMELSELEPVTMSEVGTKLDLARAYMDMGDPDGARSILEEVLQEGTSNQKQEAQRLLDSIR
jgi:pilus assembly protein FimV